MAMAQTQTEQINSPIMTVLTIQWACQNSVNSERSEDVSGSTDCATSPGFMGARPFPLSGPSVKSGAAQSSKHRSAPGEKCRARAQPKIDISRKLGSRHRQDPRNPRETWPN